MKPNILVVFAAVSALSMGGTLAQNADQEHEGHHPAESAPSTAPAASAPQPQVPPAAASPVRGMMGSAGMMGSGEMMGRGGMMSGDMMSAMGGPMEMMPSMMAGRAGAAGGPFARMLPFERIEGRIAFLRAELQITPNQEAQWKGFADALRAGAAKLKPAHQRMTAKSEGKALDPIERLSMSEQMLEARLSAVKAIRAAAAPLFSVLSDPQKKIANELLTGPMGFM